MVRSLPAHRGGAGLACRHYASSGFNAPAPGVVSLAAVRLPVGLPAMSIADVQYGAGRRQAAGIVAITHQLAIQRIVMAVQYVLTAKGHFVFIINGPSADQIHRRVTRGFPA